jgi:hypothetical protein
MYRRASTFYCFVALCALGVACTVQSAPPAQPTGDSTGDPAPTPASDPVEQAVCAERTAPVMAALNQDTWEGPFTLVGTVDGQPYEATFNELDVTVRHAGAQTPAQTVFYPNEPVSAGAMITAAYLVDGVLFLVDTYAGPAEGLLAYSALDARPIAYIGDVYSGSVSVIDDHRVAAVGSYLSSISIYDTRTGAVTKHERSLDLPCTPDDADFVRIDMQGMCDPEQNPMIEEATQRCCDAAMAAMTPYMVVGDVFDVGDGTFAVQLGGERQGDVVIFDPPSGTITDELANPCL